MHFPPKKNKFRLFFLNDKFKNAKLTFQVFFVLGWDLNYMLERSRDDQSVRWLLQDWRRRKWYRDGLSFFFRATGAQMRSILKVLLFRRQHGFLADKSAISAICSVDFEKVYNEFFNGFQFQMAKTSIYYFYYPKVTFSSRFSNVFNRKGWHVAYWLPYGQVVRLAKVRLIIL